MTVLDTSSVIGRVKASEPIAESVAIVTLIEYPPLLEYSGFTGNVIYPTKEVYAYAITIQKRLREIGRPKGSSDLLIAATCIKNNEQLEANDPDFNDIARVSSLKLI